MQKVEQKNYLDNMGKIKWEIYKQSMKSDSPMRWSWKELSFFKITDEKLYEKRLEAFSGFYEKFYEGKRTYSLDSAKQFDIFDFPDFNLAVVAYNTCYNNDHLRLVGDIQPECISESSLVIRDLTKRGRLIIGTWHHNTKGGPNDANYMDSNRLKNFIDSNIVIGFHGHQHKMEVINEYNNVIEQKKITVFSAGTLCADGTDLPTGTNRQYNIVEIESKSNNQLSVTLHVREKSESSPSANPIWIPGRIDSKNISSYEFEIPDPREVDASTIFLDIEHLMGEGYFEKAKDLLEKMDTENEIVRKFLTECILKTEDHILAIKILSPPRTKQEIIVVLHAAINTSDNGKITELLANISGDDKKDPSVNELIRQAKIKLNG
jgi:hypothetical protein